MRISPCSIVRHPICVKVALGPKQGTASGNPHLTAPFPNFPADKQESCQPNKDPPAPNEPLLPDSELCGENRRKKQEPQASDQETSHEFRIVLEIVLQIEPEFQQQLEEMNQVRSPQTFFIPLSDGRNCETGISLSLPLPNYLAWARFAIIFQYVAGRSLCTMSIWRASFPMRMRGSLFSTPFRMRAAAASGEVGVTFSK